MILKFLVAAAVIGALWMIMFRWSGRGVGKRRLGRTRRRRIAPQELVKCRDCGIYLPAGQPCGCSDNV